MDVNLFFAEEWVDKKKAIKICQSCEVRSECRDYAIDHAINDGIWGGMTDDQRKKFRRQRYQRRKAETISRLT